MSEVVSRVSSPRYYAYSTIKAPDMGEVGGSSPPRPTIQIASKYAAIFTFSPFPGSSSKNQFANYLPTLGLARGRNAARFTVSNCSWLRFAPDSSRRPRRDTVQPDWWSQTSDFVRADLRLRKDHAAHPTPTKNRRDLLCIARSLDPRPTGCALPHRSAGRGAPVLSNS